jgi:hypothetical protein
MDRGLSVRCIASGREEFVEPFLFFLSPLLASLRVVSFEVPLQITGLDETDIATFSHADIGADVVVENLVPL